MDTISELDAAIAAEEQRRAQQAAASEEEASRLARLQDQRQALVREQDLADYRRRCDVLRGDIERYERLMEGLKSKVHAMVPDIRWLGESWAKTEAEWQALNRVSRSLTTDGPPNVERGAFVSFSYEAMLSAWNAGILRGEQGGSVNA
jgi:chromosome segregation ATPase